MMLISWDRKERDPYYYKEWSLWFAWFPVKVEPGKYAWLETVERMDGRPLNDEIIWTYRRVK